MTGTVIFADIAEQPAKGLAADLVKRPRNVSLCHHIGIVLPQFKCLVGFEHRIAWLFIGQGEISEQKEGRSDQHQL
jgi:hypothetical protein